MLLRGSCCGFHQHYYCLIVSHLMKAVYAGSFDPPTIGHIDIIQRAASRFEHLTVAMGINPHKIPHYPLEMRMQWLKSATAHLNNVSVASYQGLVVDFCTQIQAYTLIRGIRNAADFDYEQQMALANRALNPEIETFFIPANPALAHISSSFVREIAAFGRDISPYLPSAVIPK